MTTDGTDESSLGGVGVKKGTLVQRGGGGKSSKETVREKLKILR